MLHDGDDWDCYIRLKDVSVAMVVGEGGGGRSQYRLTVPSCVRVR